jgi:FKBP-type peptidyl-prolyl cis-trans isomerase
MAIKSGQRVAAFLLAALFLASTVGATAYVVWEINRDPVLVNETAEEKAAAEALAKTREQEAQGEESACGQSEVAAVSPRTLPTTTKVATPVKELKTTDVKVGEGEEVQPGDCVTALYYGTLATDGTKFDGNYETGKAIEFSLNGVIAGWTEGIPGMKVGGIRRLEIPAEKGYGDQSQGSIPANADLVFEVEIVATRRGTQ